MFWKNVFDRGVWFINDIVCEDGKFMRYNQFTDRNSPVCQKTEAKASRYPVRQLGDSYNELAGMICCVIVSHCQSPGRAEPSCPEFRV